MSSPAQPLHPSMVSLLDPEYVAFHNTHVINIVPPHTLPWSPDLRNAPAVPGGAAPIPVGTVRDFEMPVKTAGPDGAETVVNVKVRAFTPEGAPPEDGWPVFIFFHGGTGREFNTTYLTLIVVYVLGGWTFGNINSENGLCTNMCVRTYPRPCSTYLHSLSSSVPSSQKRNASSSASTTGSHPRTHILQA